MLVRHGLLVLLSVFLAACPLPRPQQPLPAPGERAGVTVELAGYFHVVWNTGAHYFVTDSTGRTVELSIPADVLRSAGGALHLNGRLVRVRGIRLPEPSGTLQVNSITPQ